jgi:hypothetical protein
MAGGSIQGCNLCNVNYKPLQEVEERTGNITFASQDFLTDIEAVKAAIAQGVDGNAAVRALTGLIDRSGSSYQSQISLKEIIAARPERGISVEEMAGVQIYYDVSFASVGKIPNLTAQEVRTLADVARGKSDLFSAMIQAARSNACLFDDIVNFGKTAIKVDDYLKAFTAMVVEVAANTESKGWVAA